MNKLLPVLLLAAACVAYAVPQSGRKVSTTRATPAAPIQPPLNPQPEVEAPKPEAPPLTFLSDDLLERKIKPLQGSSFRLGDFRGKVIVINLWASWCGPCRREIPEYDKVRKEYAGRDVEFVGLTTEDPGEASEAVNRFVQQTQFGFRLGWSDHEMTRKLMNGRSSIPQTIVIDPGGGVVTHWVGYAPRQSAQRLREAIDKALP